VRKPKPEIGEEAEREPLAIKAPAREPERFVTVLESAKAALIHDAPHAAQLAQEVLDQNPPEAQQAEALAVLADAERRRGNIAIAAGLCDRLASHPSGGPVAEEALLQRAILLADIGDRRGALESLRRADRGYAGGATTPERTALEAKLLLLEGDALGAAEVIESARSVGVSLELLRRRVDVARALLDSNPARSLSLITPACAGSVPRSVRVNALEIARRAAHDVGDTELEQRFEREQLRSVDRVKVQGASGESSPDE
jgi:hypothetical protein